MKKKTIQNSVDYQEIVEDWIEETNYVNNIINLNDMVEMFERIGFGEPEIQVIMASMMACGAKFK